MNTTFQFNNDVEGTAIVYFEYTLESETHKVILDVITLDNLTDDTITALYATLDVELTSIQKQTPVRLYIEDIPLQIMSITNSVSFELPRIREDD